MATKYCPQCQQTYQEPQRFCLTDGELLSLRDPYNLVGRNIVEKYHIKALIGIGGMGVVYNAQHLSLDRRVAIKILQPNIALKNLHTLDLFQKEAKLAARLLHENIVSIMDAGRTSDDIAYMVMEWLDGRTLEEELGVLGPLSVERVSTILRQIVAALKEAHAQHIIHRDLKPSNIMLIRRSAEQDIVKVLDFGIAKLINDTMGAPVSQVMGTPHYASPEQLQVGGQIDGRSDVYSLGVMLYEMLTGKLPFNASSFQGLVRLQLTEPPPPIRNLRPELPIAIEQLINHLMAKAPERRPQLTDVPSLFEQAFEKIYELQRKGRQASIAADNDNWFDSNQLPRLPEVLLPTQPANTAYQNLHEAIPRSWQGKKLITAIIQRDRALLIYGEFYYNALLLASLNFSAKVFEYGLDFKNYGYENIPEDREFTHQYIHWASQVEDILYVSHGHNTYARSSKGRTGYVTAINIKDNRVLWTSPALISNARNFEVIDDYLITGYGFTEEPDFLFVLRRKTGDVIQKIKLKSGPDYIIRKNNDIYVRTYDTDYVFRIQRKISSNLR
jgi:serine/threonine protein kinase